MSKIVVLPPVGATREAKIKNILDKIAELMNVKLGYETMIVMTVAVPENRPDVVTVVNKIAACQRTIPDDQKMATGDRDDKTGD